jgi:glucose-1-phosphate adenylyltransferase
MPVKRVLALVLGGGRGTRLYPLTRDRSKPAVPLAGKYRIIDVPLSNCINSGVQRIYVLTQFNSVSLHRHIRRTYTFDPFSGGFVEILAAQQTLDNAGWYQGTADAVRQNLRYLQQPDIKHVLILSGDQLYRMNYADMLATHVAHQADVTIAGIPVGEEAASGLGVMRLDTAGRVEGFLEKPQTAAELDMVRTDPTWIDRQGIPAKGRSLMASMGIYLFDRDCLLDLLTKTDYQDFGREVFPAAIRAKHVQIHPFDGYWEDIGTIRSYFQCNLDLAGTAPPFDLVCAEDPQQPRLGRLRRGRRGGHRKQRDRAALPDRPQRRDPQLGGARQRLLRDRRRPGRRHGEGTPSAGHRRRHHHLRGDHRQERADRKAGADRERTRLAHDRRQRPVHDPRRGGRGAEGRCRSRRVDTRSGQRQGGLSQNFGRQPGVSGSAGTSAADIGSDPAAAGSSVAGSGAGSGPEAPSSTASSPASSPLVITSTLDGSPTVNGVSPSAGSSPMGSASVGSSNVVRSSPPSPFAASPPRRSPADALTSGGHGRGAAFSGRMPLLRARKSFCGADPFGTGPV